MIDQVKRDEWADLLIALEKWPGFWCPTFEDDEWTGEWVGTDHDGEPVTFDGTAHDGGEDFAVMVASLVTCTPDMLGHIAKLESLLTAAPSTADSLEAIGEAQIERARRHNAEVQAIVDGARMRHEEDAARIRQLELERAAWTAGSEAARAEDTAIAERALRLEVALRDACSLAQSYMDCDIPFPPDEDREALAALRKLAGEP